MEVKAIPYSTWNNRGADQMAVWIPEAAEYARATPAPTVASRARMFSEPTSLTSDAPAATSNLQWAWGYNDQWEPTSSADTSKPYHYWVAARNGTNENLCYAFDEPVEVRDVDVYWLEFDHYDGNYRVPESWQLYYKGLLQPLARSQGDIGLRHREGPLQPRDHRARHDYRAETCRKAAGRTERRRNRVEGQRGTPIMIINNLIL